MAKGTAGEILSKLRGAKKDTRYEDAQMAVQQFWGSAGDLGIEAMTEAVAKLRPEELRTLLLWIPYGQGRTAQKCSKARDVVRRALETSG